MRARAIDDLVQTAAVDPHAPAVWTVIDFDALAVGHLQLHVAGWAIHAEQSCNSCATTAARDGQALHYDLADINA